MNDDHVFSASEIAQLVAKTGLTTSEVEEVIEQGTVTALAKRRRKYFYFKMLAPTPVPVQP